LVIVQRVLEPKSTEVGRITHRSTGRQKQARFLPIGKLLAKERSHFKINFFFAFAACELIRYSLKVRFCLLANDQVANSKYEEKSKYYSDC